ncbi:MAG: polysaccharide deacetylase family protein, partial [Lachnospiraceae bacterium]|nr:polysaccharide deacetylase family protein [Lachnospiraceae bacterium]
MSKRKKKNQAVRNWVLGLIIMVFMIAVSLLSIKLIRTGKERDNRIQEVNAFEAEKQNYDKAMEDYESRISDLNNRIAELESENEQYSVKNSELESIIGQSGAKGTLKEEEKVVFLTFDDGPSDLTPKFLEVLNSYGVNATFFVTYQPQFEEIYRQIIENGNSIQIHTATHDYNSIYKSVDAYLSDFNQAYDYVCSIIDKKPVCYRFPGGSTNSYGKAIVRDIARTMDDRGFQFVDWNVSVGDGSAKATKESIVQKIMAESE